MYNNFTELSINIHKFIFCRVVKSVKPFIIKYNETTRFCTSSRKVQRRQLWSVLVTQSRILYISISWCTGVWCIQRKSSKSTTLSAFYKKNVLLCASRIIMFQCQMKQTFFTVHEILYGKPRATLWFSSIYLDFPPTAFQQNDFPYNWSIDIYFRGCSICTVFLDSPNSRIYILDEN